MLVDGLPSVYPHRGLGFDPDLCAAGKRLVWRIHNAGQAVYFCRICVMVFPAAFNSNGRVRLAILFISPNDVLIYMDALFSVFICHNATLPTCLIFNRMPVVGIGVFIQIIPICRTFKDLGVFVRGIAALLPPFFVAEKAPANVFRKIPVP